MAPPLKHPATRQRRNKVATAATLTAPEPSEHPIPEGSWPRGAVAFWDDLWSSPMVPEYVDLDARRFRMLLKLVDDFWTAETLTQRVAAATEIRMQGQLFGLSPLDRRRLQWEVKRVQAPDISPKVAPLPQRARDPRLRSVG